MYTSILDLLKLDRFQYKRNVTIGIYNTATHNNREVLK